MSSETSGKTSIVSVIRYCAASVRLLLSMLIYVIMLIFDFVVRILGLILVFLAAALLSYHPYCFFAYVIPAFPSYNIALLYLAAPFGMFFYLNAVYNYWKALTVPAGSPPLADEVLEGGHEVADDRLGFIAGNNMAMRMSRSQTVSENVLAEFAPMDVCGKCKRVRPPRTHHCSVCGVCILKMDHHCPWLGPRQCVGFGNYRFFVAFLVHLTIACVFGAISFGFALFNPEDSRAYFLAESPVLLPFVLCLTLSFAVGGLGAMHLYLVARNTTTIENHGSTPRRGNRTRGVLNSNTYDLGWKRNFKQVFGDSNFWSGLWLLTWYSDFQPGDGMHFPTTGISTPDRFNE